MTFWLKKKNTEEFHIMHIMFFVSQEIENIFFTFSLKLTVFHLLDGVA